MTGAGGSWHGDVLRSEHDERSYDGAQACRRIRLRARICWSRRDGARQCGCRAGTEQSGPVDRTGRSECAAGLRRSAQSAVLQREGRRVREQARRAVRRRSSTRSSPIPGIRRRPASCATRSTPIVRRHHGLSAGRRPRSEHQPLLPHRLCARVQAGRRPRRRRHARRCAAEGQAHRHRRRHAARQLHGGQRSDGECQALSAGHRHARRTRRPRR